MYLYRFRDEICSLTAFASPMQRLQFSGKLLNTVLLLTHPLLTAEGQDLAPERYTPIRLRLQLRKASEERHATAAGAHKGCRGKGAIPHLFLRTYARPTRVR